MVAKASLKSKITIANPNAMHSRRENGHKFIGLALVKDKGAGGIARPLRGYLLPYGQS
jgi:hypothetical protein